MSANANLIKAKNEKNDEFYTQISDIEKELIHYKQHFKDKIVYCNCDNPTWSAFWKYFHTNFSALGLKKLISTHYHKTEPTYKMEYVGGDDNNVEVGIKSPLESNGDFRSYECLDILDEADIIVTNPPFSLFREYVSCLVKHNKKFLIIGNMNSTKCKEIFPLFVNNKMWGGYSFNRTMEFIMPDSYKLKGKAFIDREGRKHGFVTAICWFTNLDINKRHEKLILWKKYSAEEYEVYDELPNVIKVNTVAEIPVDYDGYMAVPITFFDKYNPDEYELIDMLNRYTVLDYFKVNTDVRRRHSHCCNINGESTFSRIIIRKKVGA